MTTKLNFARQVSLKECMNLIDTVGREITIVIEGEPGCGKSTLLKMLRDRHGEKYDYIYFDAPVKDMTDLGMYIPRHETGQLEFYASSLFHLTSKKPKIIMIDEMFKTNKLMLTMLTRLCLEHYVGDTPLPEGSIVFATSNNASDGVGDNVQAHLGNRIMRVKLKKPDNVEWGVWATDNNVSVLTRAWAAMTPQAFHSYTTLTDAEANRNPYIFYPKRTQTSFVSPRSLYKNDFTVRNRHILGEEVALAAMVGTIGQAGAESMHAFFLIEKDLIPTREILKNPKRIPIPENAGALLMILFNAADEITTQDELSGFMEFVKRLPNKEWQSVFYTTICQAKKTVRLAKNNKELSDWMLKNFYLFS